MPVCEGDVAVIGASTSGLFAAYLLAQKGQRVRLFDQHERLGPPQRTLIVTGRINQVLGFAPHEAVVNHIEQIELLSQNRRVMVRLGVPDLVLEREKLVQLLACRAQREGVEIELGHRFAGLAESAHGLQVALHSRSAEKVKEINTRVLIGADGVRSQVAEVVSTNGRVNQHGDTGRAAILQARVVLPPGAAEHTVQVWFDKESTPFFYWLIPESKHEGVAGLVSKDQANARQHLEQFLDMRGLEATEFQAADVALYRLGQPSHVRLGSSEVFLVGDAGGQVKVTTVGGVVAGLRGAQAAVDAIFPWPNGQDGRRQKGRESRALKRELDLHFLMRSLLNGFTDSDYDQLLDLLSSQTMDVLQAHTRDELDRTFLRLILAQPRFLLLAARTQMRLSGVRPQG